MYVRGAAQDQRLSGSVDRCISLLVISSLSFISLDLFYTSVKGLSLRQRLLFQISIQLEILQL